MRERHGRSFDAENEVNGEVYRLGMELDQVEQEVRKNRQEARQVKAWALG